MWPRQPTGEESPGASILRSGDVAMTAPISGRTEDLVELYERLFDSFIGRCIRRFLMMTGIDRCIVLSSQAFTALIPLLILVSTFAPAGYDEIISDTFIRKFNLTGDSADAVTQLFATPSTVTSTLSIFSLLLLLFSGVSFTRRMQSMYRAAFEKEKAGVRGNLFAALGLVAILVEVLVAYAIRALVRQLPLDWLWSIPISAATGLVLWTSVPYLLLNRQVHWRRLLVAGGLAAVGTSLFSVASSVYMPETVARYVGEFGLFGITISLIGWLLAAAVILVASTAIGAEFDAAEGGWIGRLKVTFGLVDPGPDAPRWSRGAAAAGGEGLNAGDRRALVRVLLNWLIMAAAVWAATALVPGIEVSGGVLTYLSISVLFGLVNAFLGPVARQVVLSLTWRMLGLSALILNAILLLVTAALLENLAIDGLGRAIAGALVIAIVTTVLELVLRPVASATATDPTPVDPA